MSKADEFYRWWCVTHWHCHCCGIAAHEASQRNVAGLSTHHIVKQGRLHEACNLLRLCSVCHDLAEHRTRKAEGELLPDLPLAICLQIKKTRDPVDWNPARLAEIYRQTLPEPEPIPTVFELSYRSWRPWDVAKFFGVIA